MRTINPSLQAIADALGIPVEVFLDQGDQTNKHSAKLRETTELLAAFAQIPTAQGRRRCISYAKALRQLPA